MSGVFENYYRYWGKANKPGNGAAFHLLPYHCLDVAAVAEAWLDADTPLRRAFVETLHTAEQQAVAWVLFFSALHDIGKVDVRFQLKAPEPATTLWPGFRDARPEPKYDHGRSGYNWFREEAEAAGFGSRGAEAADLWMQAVTGHHGALPAGSNRPEPLAAPEVLRHDAVARKALILAMADLFLHPTDQRLSEVPDVLPPLLAGFCSICDWIGSNEEIFGYVDTSIPLANYLDGRRRQAAEALVRSGLVGRSCTEGGMGVLFKTLTPQGVQTLADEWPLEPGLTIIEAPTGSGKTEAALAYASRLLAAGLADSVVFALPTQATANAMLTRLEAAASRLFPGIANVVLAHGRARYNPDFLNLRLAAEGRTAQGKDEAQVHCAQWLAASRKRVFLGQVGACTVDQVLLSVLPVRHNFVRAFGVRKSVLVVDEVHAYDSYMYGLLRNVLEGQRRAGGSAVLLSATLPAKQKRSLLSAWGQPAEEPSADYPLVTHATATTARSWILARANRPKTRRVAHEVWTTEDLRLSGDHLRQIAAAAARGAHVAVILNLVADAQETARRLRETFRLEVDLFHSRYRFCDRQEKERQILPRYGRDRPSGQGHILVATQVVEQSLDLDFDWMVTQLCPVDALFQRLGRLHRHPRQRPVGFKRPRVAVLVPQGLDFGTHNAVYPDLRALWRTHQLLLSTPKMEFPAVYRRWIEAVYADKRWTDEPAEVGKAHEEYEKGYTAAYYAALSLSNADAMPLADNDANVTVLTRDGEMSLTVLLVTEDAGKRHLLDGQCLDALEEWIREEAFDLNGVSVPASWRPFLSPPDSDGRRVLLMRLRAPDDWVAVGDKASFRYTSFYGLERIKT